MVEYSAPTLAPESPSQEVLQPLPAQAQAPSLSFEKKALFDSIAHDETTPAEGNARPFLKAFFAALLWFGYSIAIVVALVLVWSAASGLLKSLPR